MEFVRRNISEVLADLPEICAAHLPSENSPILIKRGTRGYCQRWETYDGERFNKYHGITDAQAGERSRSHVRLRLSRRRSASRWTNQVNRLNTYTPCEEQRLKRRLQSVRVTSINLNAGNGSLINALQLAYHLHSWWTERLEEPIQTPTRRFVAQSNRSCSTSWRDARRTNNRCASFSSAQSSPATISRASPVCLAFVAAAESGPANFPPGEPGPKPDGLARLYWQCSLQCIVSSIDGSAGRPSLN